MNMNIKKLTGFIALTSALIISAVLLLVVATGSLSGFFTRGNVLNAEQKERSLALADACVDAARARLSGDPSYAGGDIVVVDAAGGLCQILSGAMGSPRLFKIRAVYQHAFTNLRVEIDVPTLVLVSYIEVPHF